MQNVCSYFYLFPESVHNDDPLKLANTFVTVKNMTDPVVYFLYPSKEKFT